MKNIEIEIQAKIKDPQKTEKKLKEKCEFVGGRKQTDKYFVPSDRDFFSKKQPVEYLRVREEKGKNHLMYCFLHFGEDGWLKKTDEYETEIDDPAITEEILKKIGCILKVIVKKERKYFNCGNFEVVLDKIENLGNFIEVEAKKDLGGEERTKKACLGFLNDLGVDYEMRKDMGYPNMIYGKLRNKK